MFEPMRIKLRCLAIHEITIPRVNGKWSLKENLKRNPKLHSERKQIPINNGKYSAGLLLISVHVQGTR